MITLHSQAVSCVLLRQRATTTEALLLKRSPEDGGFWSYVSGGVELGETGPEAALREIFEETGLSPVELYSADFIEQYYQASKNRIMLLPLFVAFVETSDLIVLNHEHTEYRWCGLEVALSLLRFDGQIKAFTHVWHQFVKKPPLDLLAIPIPTMGRHN
ncbi:NUDIX pyrophosphatase [Reinekea sp. G2M2-21]|uniref:NUDIX hydrolase n=1 Tax=Reinekea sp. G2M2-21 TaxID=2788942 RepID=UPI0018AA4853|nr:NUDIX domain-containing protein [Reinekea sp. G2M2-21]